MSFEPIRVYPKLGPYMVVKYVLYCVCSCKIRINKKIGFGFLSYLQDITANLFLVGLGTEIEMVRHLAEHE